MTSNKGAQGTTIELSRPPGKTPRREDAAVGPPLGRRVFRLRNLASFLLALVVLYLVYRQLLGLDWGQVLASVRGANAGLFTLAFLVFYGTFFLRALRWKALLGNVGYSHAADRPMPSAFGLTRIMYLAWFANCVTVARLGDAYRGYLLKKATGVSFAVTLGTVLAERLLDLLVLAATMGAGVMVLFGGSLPTQASQALAAGLVLSAVGVVGLLAVRRFRWAFELVLPKRLHAHYFRLEHGVIDSFRSRLPLLVAYSVAGWVMEGMTLYAVAAAVGAPVSVAGALVVALAASLLTTVPITPSGLGLTEAGVLVMLGWMGLDAPTASAITFLFRVINYWSIVVLGFLLYVFSRNTNQLKERLGTPGVSIRIHRFFTG
jgi:uncharacterized protein (TIRG00374 family)